jgi:hypothetical protein
LLDEFLIEVHAMGNPQTSTWQTGVNLVESPSSSRHFIPALRNRYGDFSGEPGQPPTICQIIKFKK